MAVRAGDHYDGPVLAGAVRVVRPCPARRRGGGGGRRDRGDPHRWDAPLSGGRRKARLPRLQELFRTQRLSDQSFSEAIAAFGERGIVEIISIIGYYTLI